MQKKFGHSLVLTLGLTGALFSTVPAWGQARAEPKTVVIGVEDDWAPFAWVERNQTEPLGYSVEVVRLAFQQMGVPLELSVMPFGRCMREARRGRLAGCFNAVVDRDDESERAFFVPSVALFNEPLAVLTRASAPKETLDIHGLEGRRVGYVQSYQYPDWFAQSKTIIQVPASSDSALLQMLDRGRVDCVLFGATVAAWRLQNESGLSGIRVRMAGQLANNGFGVVFSRNHPQGEALQVRFNKAIQSLQSSDRLTELRRKFLPVLPQ